MPLTAMLEDLMLTLSKDLHVSRPQQRCWNLEDESFTLSCTEIIIDCCEATSKGPCPSNGNAYAMSTVALQRACLGSMIPAMSVIKMA